MTHPQLLGYLTRVTLVAIAPFCTAAHGGEKQRTQPAASAFLWQVTETDLTSSKTYANPYGEVDVTVTFTGPRGESITRSTFWDGGSAWKVRFAPTAFGSWNWQTECSDQTNDGMNGRSGRLECLPRESANGQWKIPIRPDGDWVLVVRKRDRTATTQTVVAPSDDYPRNSEATLIVSNSGELLLFYGAHVGSGDWDRAVIRAVRSADGGRTWSEPTTQLEDPRRSLFQPSLTRLANGELGLTHTVLAHGQDAHKVFRRSADEGRTWSEPLKISDDSHAYTTGPHDRLYTLSSGRLLALLHCNLAPKKDRQGGPLGAYVVYSDDHGQTWTRTPGDRVLHVADNPYHKHEWGFWEPSLVEHEPGMLLMMARTATGWLYECRSADGGSTWTDPARSAVPNPLAPPALTQIPDTRTIVLLHNPRVEMESGWHGGPRTVLALRTSRDGGRIWSDPRSIAESGDENDWYDYPAVRWVDDTLHVAYRAIATRNRGQGGFRTVGIEYRTLTSAWLKEVNQATQGHGR